MSLQVLTYKLLKLKKLQKKHTTLLKNNVFKKLTKLEDEIKSLNFELIDTLTEMKKISKDKKEVDIGNFRVKYTFRNQKKVDVKTLAKKHPKIYKSYFSFNESEFKKADLGLCLLDNLVGRKLTVLDKPKEKEKNG